MDILEHPNPALKQHAAPADPASDASIIPLVRAMAEAMYEAPGVGLAATQVGVQKRVIVIDVDDQLIALCNPVISDLSKETDTEEEGCLSLPGITVPVDRPVRCVCDALDVKGGKVRIKAEGFMARVLQHETDHLDGILMIDRATPDERRAAIRRYRDANQSR